mgnify:CR=1 FL=1
MYNLIKRFFDILFSLIIIIILIPLFVPVIILLFFTGENEIFYRQIRVGKNNKDFGMLKFVTMVKNSPNIGTGIYTAKNDPRVLPVGKFLRKTKINELPQIFNILLGDMSFVGPRPLIRRTYLFYTAKEQKIIGSVKPGLTGIGSVFFRDEESLFFNVKTNLEDYYKNNIAPSKASLELWYINRKSFYVDFMIILTTAWVIFFPKSNLLVKVFKNLPDL